MSAGNTSKISLSHQSNFMTSGMIAMSVATAGTMLSRVSRTEYGQTLDYSAGDLTKGDIAILRFLAAMELIESDLWQQYEELGGATSSSDNRYRLALEELDAQISQHITRNTQCEISHAAYLNAFLKSEGVEPVDLDRFRVLRGSTANSAHDVGRLTNLFHLDMDTKWYLRYRSLEDPDSGPFLSPTFRIANRQAIPRTEADCERPAQIQAIANTAAFHFGYIEHVCASLYSTLSQNLKRARVLKVALGIGGDEIAQFLTWADFAGVATQGSPFCFGKSRPSSTENGMSCWVFDIHHRRSFSRHEFNCPATGDFMSKVLRQWPVVLPRDDQFDGAAATINSFTQNGLFVAQSPDFLRKLAQMAQDADAAARSQSSLRVEDALE